MGNETVTAKKVESNERLTFLYKAIEDTQQSVRFIDTKLSINSIVFSILIAFIGSGLADFSKYFWNMPGIYQSIFIGAIIAFVVSLGMIIIITLNVIYPRSSPSKHISMEYKPKKLFYLWDIKTSFEDSILDRKDVILKPSFEDYKIKFDEMCDSHCLENELIYELLKVSFIREIKIRRIRYIRMWVIIALILSLILLYLHFSGLSCYMPKVVR